MSYAKSSDNSATVSLLPFLAVLICTMGSLLLILVVVTRVAREQSEREVVAQKEERARERERQLKLQSEGQLEQIQHYMAQLDKARVEASKKLLNDQRKLSHIEDHMRRLREKLESLKVAAQELAALEEEHVDDREQAERELKRLQKLIHETRDEIVDLKAEASKRPPSYAIVPYEGKHGTHRPPIYIECLADRVIIQPEGVELTEQDFLPPLSAGNALASAIRAAREYMVKPTSSDQANKILEPYPLILVRPDGVMAYYHVRNALKSWDAAFGYELIDEDWDLEFPPANPQLAQIEQEAVERARERQRMLAIAAPSAYAAARRRLASLNQDSEPSYSSGGFSLENDDEMPHGTGGLSLTGSGSEPGGASDNQLASPGTDSAVVADAPANSPKGDGLQHLGPPPESIVFGGSENAASKSSSIVKVSGGPHRGSGPAHSNSTHDALDNRGLDPLTDSSELADSMEGGSSGSNGTGSNGSGTKGAGSNDSDSRGQTSVGSAFSAATKSGGSVGPQSLEVPQDARPVSPLLSRPSPKSQPGSSADGLSGLARGESGMRDIPVRRSIHVVVMEDRLTILSDNDTVGAGLRSPLNRNIKLDGSAEDAGAEFVKALKEHVAEWGMAGRGLYWRPILMLEVLDGGQHHALALEKMLRESGIETRFISTALLEDDSKANTPR